MLPGSSSDSTLRETLKKTGRDKIHVGLLHKLGHVRMSQAVSIKRRPMWISAVRSVKIWCDNSAKEELINHRGLKVLGEAL